MRAVIHVQILGFRSGMGIVPLGKYRLALWMMRGMRSGIRFRVVRPKFRMAFLIRTGDWVVMGPKIMV
ncbi:MAG: hypothetical protein WC391_03180 [Methanoregula sp.]|jgi:hypothetical protein